MSSQIMNSVLCYKNVLVRRLFIISTFSCLCERITFFSRITTESTLNFLSADDPRGTHRGFLRVAVLKMDALITHFEAGKEQLNLLFMSNYLLRVKILPLSIFTYS